MMVDIFCSKLIDSMHTVLAAHVCSAVYISKRINQQRGRYEIIPSNLDVQERGRGGPTTMVLFYFGTDIFGFCRRLLLSVGDKEDTTNG